MEKATVVFLHRLENRLISGELVKVTDTGYFCVKAHDNKFYWISDPADIRWAATYEELKKYEDIKNWDKDYFPYDI